MKKPKKYKGMHPLTAFRKNMRKTLLNGQNDCALCSEPITNMKDATIDHIKPLSKGGLDIPENYQVVHRWCNQEKGNSDIIVLS